MPENLVTAGIQMSGKSMNLIAKEMGMYGHTNVLYWQKKGRVPLDRLSEWYRVTGQHPRDARPDIMELMNLA